MHFGDYTFIFILALVLLGPKKMPEMGRQLGKLLAEFRRASNEFKFQIQEELRNMEEEERKKKLAESQALATASDQAMIEAGASSRADAGPTILPPASGDPISAARPFAVPAELPENAASLQAIESVDTLAAPLVADADVAPLVPDAEATPLNGAAETRIAPAAPPPSHPVPDPDPAAEPLTHG